MTDPIVPGFWEIGAYKTNVRRIKDGVEQIEELNRMARERAEIESKYAKSLQAFSERWKGTVERTVHGGAVKAAWSELIEESEALAAQHGKIGERLQDEIMKTLSLYRKEQYHRAAFRSPKEIREIEHEFEKAQKPWRKLFDKVENAKKAYHLACRNERSSQVALTNSQADTSISPDNIAKIKERHQKLKDDVTKTKKTYETQLQETSQYRDAYMKSMSYVFEKCQQAEQKRARFVIEMIAAEETVLADLVRNPKFIALHNKMEYNLKKMDEGVVLEDLKQWSAEYGTEAPTEWPAFEEYSYECRQIANARNPKDAGGVVLTKQILKNDDVPVPGPASSNGSNTLSSEAAKRNSIAPHSKDSDSDTNTYDSHRTNSNRGRGETRKQQPGWAEESLPATTPDSAKYADFEDDAADSLPSREATVLYDYIAVEEDEIPLKKGQKIELLSQPDELGWCRGRVGEKTGLFPALYVKAL